MPPSMADLLVDTDVLVDHLRGSRRLERASGDRIAVSTITRAELFAGSPAQREAVRRLLDPLGELPVDRSVAELAGGIRSGTGIALPDALIAATALHHSLEILTRNERDFGRVDGLVIASR